MLSISEIEFLKNLVENHKRSFFRILQNQKNSDLLKKIIEYNNFCKNEKYSISQLVYNVINGLHNFPKCKNEICNNLLSDPDQFRNITEGYNQFCCRKCSMTDENTILNRQNTLIKLYGVPFALQNEYLKRKAMETNLKNFGNTCYLASEIGRQTVSSIKLDKYGNPFYNNPHQIIQTKMEHNNGVIVPETQLEKMKQTNKDRYGYEFVSQVPEFKLAARESFLSTLHNTYGDDVNSISDIPGVRDQIVKTFQHNHNVSGDISCTFQLDWFKDYCIDYFNENYGVDYFTQTEEYKIKSQETSIKNYGVPFWIQNHDKRVKSQNGFEFNDMFVQSSWEVAFMIYLQDHKINFDFQPNTYFEYEYDNKIFKYYPDFLLKSSNKYIEIKGNLYFKDGDPSKEMICPYKQNKYPQDWINGKFEAKHQCMIKNNISILTQTEMNPILDYIKETYGKNYLKKFRRSGK